MQSPAVVAPYDRAPGPPAYRQGEYHGHMAHEMEQRAMAGYPRGVSEGPRDFRYGKMPRHEFPTMRNDTRAYHPPPRYSDERFGNEASYSPYPQYSRQPVSDMHHDSMSICCPPHCSAL
jgi:hypothetical protein